MYSDQNKHISAEEKQLARQIADELGAATIYENSFHRRDETLFFMLKRDLVKLLVIVTGREQMAGLGFRGQAETAGGAEFFTCALAHENAEALRTCFPFTNPVLIGKKNSYGYGDRLGNAGPAHLRSVKGTGFKPVLAQQSIRELERTGRKPEDVMDAASWAVFQEGYSDGFGADADHLKTTADIDRMVDAGFTMFTIDPSEYVFDGSAGLEADILENLFQDLPWTELEDKPQSLLSRYVKQTISLDGRRLSPEPRDVQEAMVKYGRVLSHTSMMVRHLAENHSGHPAEIELSVDETEQPTTPFEHFLIASELSRLDISLVSLAPRFCGDFEKGVDFRGDLDQFRDEYKMHLAIAGEFGGYKLSIHSGSDKFSVYEVIGSLDEGAVHVKTAGTSYLEALRTLARADPQLFRDILTFSMSRFEEDRNTYHISARLSDLPDVSALGENQLIGLLDNDEARQVLHVAYGSVLSGGYPEAEGFRSRLMEVLSTNEMLYEENLVRHFEKHLRPFRKLKP
ncbi:MAG: tagaturonate epimerase family protein [Balneolaceae bacterium]